MLTVQVILFLISYWHEFSKWKIFDELYLQVLMVANYAFACSPFSTFSRESSRKKEIGTNQIPLYMPLTDILVTMLTHGLPPAQSFLYRCFYQMYIVFPGLFRENMPKIYGFIVYSYLENIT